MYLLLPGMGADHRMYPRAWSTLPQVQRIDWPAYQGEKTIRAIAENVARAVRLSPDAWLVGSSLGGMVACELSTLAPVKGVILIGSTSSAAEISHFRWLLPLVDLAPFKVGANLASLLPDELTQMFGASDPAFIQAMCKAVLHWPGVRPPTPCFRIHGRYDLIIPPPATCDVLIAGGHLIALTHAEDCVAAVGRLTQPHRQPSPSCYFSPRSGP